MIFGFNTDIKQGAVAYHVQSEVRQSEPRLETQVFVGGRCLGKYSFAIDEMPESEQELQDKLRLQHRQVLEAIREDRLDSLFAAPELKVEWLGAKVEQSTMRLRFRVNTVPAVVSAWLETGADTPKCSQAEATPEGTVELELSFEDADMIVVQVNAAGRTLTQKFRLHRQ
jgi:hypothetical protein